MKAILWHCGNVEIKDFDELPDTYTIFITENDLFGKREPYYPIERMNMVTNELFNDGEHILYINGAYRGDDEIGKLMHDFSCSDPDEMNNQDLADIARYYKETQEGVETMCKAMEEMRTKKEQETIILNLHRMMKNLQLTLEQAMDALEIPVQDRAYYSSVIK